MTREEAIKTLRELWRETNDSWYEEVFRMAIEALQTDVVRCKDCRHHGMSGCPVWGDDTTEDYMWCFCGEKEEI